MMMDHGFPRFNLAFFGILWHFSMLIILRAILLSRLRLLVPEPTLLRIVDDGLMLLNRGVPFNGWRWIELHGAGILTGAAWGLTEPPKDDLVKYESQLQGWGGASSTFPNQDDSDFSVKNAMQIECKPGDFGLHLLWMRSCRSLQSRGFCFHAAGKLNGLEVGLCKLLGYCIFGDCSF